MLAPDGGRTDLRAVGVTGWAVILGLALAWEGLGLAYAREGWPSLSDLLRAVSRPVVGRWILLALWLWLGWHLFVRGWQPLLRGSPAPRIASAALSVGQLVRQVVVPLLLTYAALLTAVVLRGRGRRPATAVGGALPRPTALGIVRHVGLTLLVGYAAFLVLVVSYYAVVADQTPAFLRAAVSGGAFITFAVALPGLVLLSGAEARLRRRSIRR